MKLNLNDYAYLAFTQLTISNYFEPLKQQGAPNNPLRQAEDVKHFAELITKLRTDLNNHFEEKKKQFICALLEKNKTGHQTITKQFAQVINSATEIVPSSATEFIEHFNDSLSKFVNQNRISPKDGTTDERRDSVVSHTRDQGTPNNALSYIGQTIWIDGFKQLTGVLNGNFSRLLGVTDALDAHYASTLFECVFGITMSKNESNRLVPKLINIEDRISHLYNYYSRLNEALESKEFALSRCTWLLQQLMVSTTYHQSLPTLDESSERECIILAQHEALSIGLALLKTAKFAGEKHTNAFIDSYLHSFTKDSSEHTLSLSRVWHHTTEQKKRIDILCAAMTSPRTIQEINQATGLDIFAMKELIPDNVKAYEYFKARVKQLLHLDYPSFECIYDIYNAGHKTISVSHIKGPTALLQNVTVEHEELNNSHYTKYLLPISLAENHLGTSRFIQDDFPINVLIQSGIPVSEILEKHPEKNDELILLGVHPSSQLVSDITSIPNATAEQVAITFEPNENKIFIKAILTGITQSFGAKDNEEAFKLIDNIFNLRNSKTYSLNTQQQPESSLVLNLLSNIDSFINESGQPFSNSAIIYAILKEFTPLDISPITLHNWLSSTENKKIEAIKSRHPGAFFLSPYAGSLGTSESTQDQLVKWMDDTAKSALQSDQAINLDGAIENFILFTSKPLDEAIASCLANSDDTKRENIRLIYQHLLEQFNHQESSPHFLDTFINTYDNIKKNLNRGMLPNILPCLLTSLWPDLKTENIFNMYRFCDSFTQESKHSTQPPMATIESFLEIQQTIKDATLIELILLLTLKQNDLIEASDLNDRHRDIRAIFTNQPSDRYNTKTTDETKELTRRILTILSEDPNNPNNLIDAIKSNIKDWYPNDYEADKQAHNLALELRAGQFNVVTRAFNQLFNDSIDILTNRIVCAFLAQTFICFLIVFKSLGFFSSMTPLMAVAQFITMYTTAIFALWGVYSILKYLFVQEPNLAFDFTPTGLSELDIKADKFKITPDNSNISNKTTLKIIP